MTNRLKEMGESRSWHLLVGAARLGAEREGYKATKKPGRGLSNTWVLEKDGTADSAAIRTTRDRWLAFPPLEGGKRWKTLDDVDLVLVAAVDDPHDPQNVDVYLFPADEVRRRFDAAYQAREQAGHTIRDNYGMWINLDPDQRGLPSSVGCGLAKAFPAIARFSLDELMQGQAQEVAADVGEPDETEVEDMQAAAPALSTVGEVMAFARAEIARITNMPAAGIKLDLKIEY